MSDLVERALVTTPAAPLRAIAEELVRGGVRDVVVCPGSRSTPMALALRVMPGLRCWVHFDERGGGFFALGAAKAARRPAAVLVTSGTAAVNLAPAVTEARYGRVPLLLLTADRPAELRGRGSPQTIDQADLFGRASKWWAEVPAPEATPSSEETARALVRRALEVATQAPAGPVQLNLPFREPLLPVGPLTGAAASVPVEDPPEPRDAAHPALPVAVLEELGASVAAARRGLIVVGPLDLPGMGAAIARLAAASGFPVFADGLANVRRGPHDHSNVIVHHDALLRTETVARRQPPDLVLRFGGTPTSKALDRLLASVPASQVLIDDGGGWERPPEPRRMVADPVAFAHALAEALPGPGPTTGDDSWLRWWRAADVAAGEALRGWRAAREEPFEGAIFEQVETALPAGAILFAGSSMPVRDLDAFLGASPAELRCLGNRGANGIDGLLSTALGAAAAQAAPVVAVVGDLAFLHDLNALVSARRLGIDATIVLIHNDGGGIFSFLPQATAALPEAGLPELFEELFGTPHGTDFGPLVTALGAEHRLAGPGDLATVVRESVDRPRLVVIELRTDRARNVALHRQAQAAVTRALEGLA